MMVINPNDAISKKPIPKAMPSAATAHIDADVVSPEMLRFVMMMVPAPRNPIPETTCAIRRDESELIPVANPGYNRAS